MTKSERKYMKIRRRFLSTLFLFLTVICGTTVYSQEDSVIVQGNPPLKASTFAKTVILVEWALDVKFTEDEKVKMANTMVKYWQENNRAEIESVLEVVKIYDGLAKAGDEDRKKAKDVIREEILKALKNDPDDEMNRVVLQAYKAAQKGSSKDTFADGGDSTQNSNASNTLVGKWDSFGNYTSYEFFADGRYIFHATVKMTNLTCATTLITNITGKYRLQGAILTLDPATGINEFKYSCPSRTEKKSIAELGTKSVRIYFKQGNMGENLCLTDNEKTESCYVKIK
jgi:DNA-binding Lrp family transcriptional regulator